MTLALNHLTKCVPSQENNHCSCGNGEQLVVKLIVLLIIQEFGTGGEGSRRASGLVYHCEFLVPRFIFLSCIMEGRNAEDFIGHIQGDRGSVCIHNRGNIWALKVVESVRPHRYFLM